METFPIAPAASRALWLVTGLLGLVLVLVLVFVGWSVLGARWSRFEVSRDGLRLTGDWYGRTVPVEQLRIGEARSVDLSSEPSLAPRTRTLGPGLPGYQAGWFRLRNGERALLYVTDRRRVVYVPTTAGYGLLLSPAEPDAFLSALRAVAR
jgi:hypothetical protein